MWRGIKEGRGEFIPRKHPIQTPAQQKRAAKKRKGVALNKARHRRRK